MTLALHNLTAAKNSHKRKRRLGRGNASGRGTYSGRGQKGQRSRSGGKKKLKRRGFKALLQNKPKIGGFKSLKPKLATVNLKQLERYFANGEVVEARKLLAKNLIKAIKPGVKILGDGALTKKFTVIADAFSESAKQAILKAGGKVEVRVKPK